MCPGDHFIACEISIEDLFFHLSPSLTSLRRPSATRLRPYFSNFRMCLGAYILASEFRLKIYFPFRAHLKMASFLTTSNRHIRAQARIWESTRVSTIRANLRPRGTKPRKRLLFRAKTTKNLFPRIFAQNLDFGPCHEKRAFEWSVCTSF